MAGWLGDATRPMGALAAVSCAAAATLASACAVSRAGAVTRRALREAAARTGSLFGTSAATVRATARAISGSLIAEGVIAATGIIFAASCTAGTARGLAECAGSESGI